MPKGVYKHKLHTEGTKEKISKSIKIAMSRPETKKKMSNSHKGKKFPKELYPNHGMRGKKPWNTGLSADPSKENYDERVARLGKKVSEANRGKKRLPFSKMWKEHLSESHKGIKYLNRKSSGPLSEDCKRKISKANKGKKKPPRSLKYRKNISKHRIAKWQEPEFQKMMAKAFNLKPNCLEQFYDKLTPEYVQYVGDFKFPISMKIGTRFPDFVVKNQNKIIELFGDYWHEGESPEYKIREYKEVGWNCKVFWENEIYNEPERVLKETLEFIKEE